MLTTLLRGVGEESADARKFARCRGSTKPLPAPIREKRPQVGGRQAEQARRRHLFTAIAPEEFDQSMGGCNIGPNGMCRAPAVVLKIGAPLGGERLRRMN